MNRQLKPCALILMALCCLIRPAISEIRLPRLISNGMVLQRDAPVKIWGWAAPGESIRLEFMDSTYQIKASDKGEWSVMLGKLKAGGPYKMTLRASNLITLSDILVGDVWVCSGQSNMEYPMSRLSHYYTREIASSDNPMIRQFIVPQQYNFNRELNDLPYGSWKPANPSNLLQFSAVAYFFARELFSRYKVPIGIINASLGGSPAEAWISEEALKEFPDYYREQQQFKDSMLIRHLELADRERSMAWYTLLRQNDEGYQAGHEPWTVPQLQTSDWSTFQVPGYLSASTVGQVNGVIWFRKEIQLPESYDGQPGSLLLGRMVDADSVFLNGNFIGTTAYMYPQRRYEVPAGILKRGKNSLVVRLISNSGNGGFVPDKPYELISGNDSIDLKGTWLCKLGAKMDPLQGGTTVRWKPGGLYNGMISPLEDYRVKGIVWYQGESNAEKAIEYRALFPALIADWRKHWGEGEFPFIYVQLPNYMEPKKEPGESNWALLRDAQFRALSVKNTAMVVAIDLGEWNDIHPLRKKEVGIRIALAAERMAYGDNLAIGSGPLYQSMTIQGNKVVLSFGAVGSGLEAKGRGTLQQFAICGEDRKFTWANARIDHNQVIVWNDSIDHPVAVRYAWADNPEGANLYNQDGLPASPFRTDDW